MSVLDTNNDDSISYNEFIKYAIPQAKESGFVIRTKEETDTAGAVINAQKVTFELGDEDLIRAD
jgi:hypothetical protein